MKTTSHASPLTVRGTRIQDSSLSTPFNPEESLAKISAMFPNVPDAHIRLLLKKYVTHLENSNSNPNKIV